MVINGKRMAPQSLWRADCDQNPLKNQQGSWAYPREGWCPGEDVLPWLVDLGAKTGSFMVSYADPTMTDANNMEVPYTNTCQPNLCMQNTCAFMEPCAYDGGAHTEPNFAVSAVVIGYR